MGYTFTARLGPDPLQGDSDLGGYRVVHHKHGVAVFGQMPVSDLAGLQKNCEAQGFDQMDFGIATALDATFALSSLEGCKEWRREISERLERAWPDDKEMVWASGVDTGTSSASILFVLGESQRAKMRATNVAWRTRSQFGSLPWDLDDLGRCVRLLDLFPAWRSRLGEVATAYPEWGLLVSRWTELEALYKAEMPGHSGEAPRTHALLRRLVGHSAASVVDLSAVRDGSDAHFRALDIMLDGIINHEESLPDQIDVWNSAGEGGIFELRMWDRNGSSVFGAVSKALAGMDGGEP